MAEELFSFIRSVNVSAQDFEELLLQHLSELNTKNKKNRTLLTSCVKKCLFELVDVIFKVAEDNAIALDVNNKDDGGNPVLFYALSYLKYYPKFVHQFIMNCTAGDLHQLDLTLTDASNTGVLEHAVHNISPENSKEGLQLIRLLVELGTPIPSTFTGGTTLIEALIVTMSHIDIQSRSYDIDLDSLDLDQSTLEEIFQGALDEMLLLFDAIDEVVKQQNTQLPPTAVDDLFTQGANRNNVLHLCCLYNQVEVLEYFLNWLGQRSAERIAANIDQNQSFKDQLLNQLNNTNLPPLLICALFHLPTLREQSRVGCARLLVDAGAKFDENMTIFNITPLSFCISLAHFRTIREDFLCYLLDMGADPDKFARIPGTLLGFKKFLIHVLIYQFNTVLQWLITHKKFEPNEILDIGETNAFHLAAVICAEIDLRAHQEEPGIIKAMEEACEMLIRYGCSTSGTLYSLMMFRRTQRGKQIFKTLLELGVDPNQTRGSEMSLIANSVVCDDISLFRLLLVHGAALQLPFNVRVCINTPAHRWITFSSLAEKYVSSGLELPDQDSFAACDICMKRISNLKDSTTTCAAPSICNMDVCVSCSVFSASSTVTDGSKRKQGGKIGEVSGITPLDMSKRTANAPFINYLQFLASDETGKQLLQKLQSIPTWKTSGLQLIDMFIAAGLTNKILTSQLSEERLRRLGIVDGYENILKAVR